MEVKTEDFYEDMEQTITEYDSSGYPKYHYLHSTDNKKAIGKMRDECVGRQILGYAGLRPKMYSILESSGVNIKKIIGVKKYVVKKEIRHSQYKKCLFDKQNHSDNEWTPLGHLDTKFTGNV